MTGLPELAAWSADAVCRLNVRSDKLLDRVRSPVSAPFAGMIRIRFYGCNLSSSARKNTPASGEYDSMRRCGCPWPHVIISKSPALRSHSSNLPAFHSSILPPVHSLVLWPPMSSPALEVLHAPWLNALVSLLLNLPFGYWRAGCRNWSGAWFAAIHVPIVLVVGLRFCLGTPFRLATLPLYALAFLAGQFLGARLRR